MSLTSYRAAPPRVTRFLPKAKYRDEFLALNAFSGPVFAERKIPFVTLLSHPALKRVHFARLRKHKGRLERPFGFGRAECVSRRSSPVFYLAVKTCGILLTQKPVHIAFSRPGSDLLSRVLRRSTIGAGAFHGRVRNGNGCGHPAITTRSAKGNVMRSWQRQSLICLIL